MDPAPAPLREVWADPFRRDEQDSASAQLEAAHLLASLLPARAGLQSLLELVRGRWGEVENGLCYEREMAVHEDACRVRTGTSPPALAALRNLTVTILRLLKVEGLKRTMKGFCREGSRAATILLG